MNIAETAGTSSSRIGNNIHPLNRSLPAFQSSTSNPQSHNLIEIVGASGIRETYGKPAWTNPSNGTRLLPPTMMPAKHSSSTPLVGLNDSFYQTGVGEERPVAPDERFVFQAAVQVLSAYNIFYWYLSSLVTIFSYEINSKMRACS